MKGMTRKVENKLEKKSVSFRDKKQSVEQRADTEAGCHCFNHRN